MTEIKELLDDQTQGGDSTDGVITLFEDILQSTLDTNLNWGKQGQKEFYQWSH